MESAKSGDLSIKKKKWSMTQVGVQSKDDRSSSDRHIPISKQ